jgi:hypothetical protein
MVPYKSALGDQVLRSLLPHVGKLGIQAIIWKRRIYSRKNPGGAVYRGVSPHYDHLHIELNRAAGRGLTKNAVRAALSGKVPPAPKAPAHKKPVATKPTVRLSNVQPGKKNNDVLRVQRALQREVGLNFASGPGTFGTKTRLAYRAWQVKFLKGIRKPVTASSADGVPGLASLAALGAKYGFRVIP